MVYRDLKIRNNKDLANIYNKKILNSKNLA